MDINQAYQLLNKANAQTVEGAAIEQEDLSGLDSVRDNLANLGKLNLFGKNLIDVIGLQRVVSKVYKGRAPSVYKESWRFGSIMQRINFEMPETSENKAWDIQNGQSYDPNVFLEATVYPKYFNNKTVFQVTYSLKDDVLYQAFNSASAMLAFMTGLETAALNKLTVDLDNLIMRTINLMTAKTIHDANPNRVVKLITNYNKENPGAAVTIDNCLKNPDFIKYMSLTIGEYTKRLSVVSTLFNIDGREKFTDSENLHVIMLDRVKRSADVYLQADTFHNEMTKLPMSESVAYWQGTGTNYALGDISKIDVIIDDEATSVTQAGVACVMFDDDCLGVTCDDGRTTSNVNPVADFTNYWIKRQAMYFADTAEQFVVFLLA